MTPTVHWYSVTATVGVKGAVTYSVAFQKRLAARQRRPASLDRGHADVERGHGLSSEDRELHGEIPAEESTRMGDGRDRVLSQTSRRERVGVHRPNKFWTLQLREGLLYLAFGTVLLGGAWACVRRIEP